MVTWEQKELMVKTFTPYELFIQELKALHTQDARQNPHESFKKLIFADVLVIFYFKLLTVDFFSIFLFWSRNHYLQSKKICGTPYLFKYYLTYPN